MKAHTTQPWRRVNEAERLTRDFGAQLARVLDRLGWTCGDLAARSGVDRSTLSRIVAGETQPQLATFAKVLLTVAHENRGWARALSFRLDRVLSPMVDGDERDLTPICARLVRDASATLDAVLTALADGRIDVDELAAIHAAASSAAERCELLERLASACVK